MSRITIVSIGLLVVIAFFLNASLFTVAQTEQVLVVQFGEVVRPIEQPGLHVKVPIVQNVISFDRRLMAVELPGEEVILNEQRRLIVDTFTVFRISNPLLFYQAIGPIPDNIRGRLNSVVTGSLRRVLGNNKLLDVLSSDRERIMATIRGQVNTEMQNFGVNIVDVRIRRADLPQENTQAILSRMQSERQRIAAQARAEGAEASQRIRADAERDRTVLVADARAKADNLRGEGEGEATNIYAKAFGQDPAFFSIWRTLQGYRDIFEAGAARLVVTPDNEYLKFLQAPPADPSR
ncbi:MAG: modulator of FtsH protease HflC [Acetobacteraceae bacterium]|jgi:membrane protease subunit HflC|nr:modulator of FtsH protease HflC [Acetobacteraceae bacterium]MEA2776539.1 modulator of FtsH protease HflC [Acetobacteraceae bacterium]MEA2789651.1 modulator of FtsH protease HflC [Acetobacteraceae bacterium]